MKKVQAVVAQSRRMVGQSSRSTCPNFCDQRRLVATRLAFSFLFSGTAISLSGNEEIAPSDASSLNAQTAEMAIASRLEVAFEAQPLWSTGN
jgi:hypothetical protein